MLLKLKALLHLWDDADKTKPLFVPSEEDLLAVEVDGYLEYQAGKLRLLATDGPASVPFGTISEVRAMLLRVEGAAGADVTINGGTARELRPVTDAESASELTPVSFLLETSADLATVSIAHPGPGTADPIEILYLLVGDAAA